MRRLIALFVVAVTILAPGIAPADTGPGNLVRIATTGSYAAPLGFQLFCLTTPAHCRSDSRGEIVLTQDVFDLLGAVNRSVNTAIEARSDRSDTWSINVAEGDCEDFALTKRAQLIAAGIPAGALRIGVGTYRGEGHAVLIVRTSQGDLVLDNLSNAVRYWQDTGIRWIAMSGANPLDWQSIG